MKYVPKRLEHTADVSRGESNLRETATGIATVLGALCVAYVLLGFATDFVAERIPASWEPRLSAFAVMASDDSHTEDHARVSTILDRLIASGDLRGLDYELVITDDETPNAFAVLGGTIGVTKGLLDTVSGEKGLAMVLAHELGHHDARHVLKGVGRALLVVIPVSAFSGEAGRWVGTFTNMIEGKYSRDQEREADRIGLALVHATYGSTDGVLEFFERMLEEHGPRNRWATMVASHPATEHRIEALREQAALLEAGDAR